MEVLTEMNELTVKGLGRSMVNMTLIHLPTFADKRRPGHHLLRAMWDWHALHQGLASVYHIHGLSSLINFPLPYR